MVNWKLPSLCALLALLDIATATTAPNFPITGGSPDLTIAFGSNTVSPPGELIPRGDTASPPNVTTPVWPTANKAVVMMVDIDVPRNGTRVQLLHWLASNVTLASGSNSSLSVPSTAEAAYLQPSPPVGDTPHAYTILLFSQPDGFSVPSEFTSLLQSRVFWNTSAFVAAAGLQSPVAANYFRVQNVSGTATQSFPPPASTPTNGTSGTGTPQPFPGGAKGLEERAWLAVAGTVMLAGFMGFLL